MASTNLSRANGSGSATTKFTYSVWLKYSGFVSGGQRWFSATGGSGDTYFRFNETGEMEISGDNSAATSLGYFITNRKFRDHSAWMHIVIKVDTTQSTQTDRFKLYINGVDEAGVGGYSTGTYPNQNADDNISLSSNTHYIGGAASSQYFNGSMTHIHYSDGYAYDASTFGETDSTSGIWKPKTNPTGMTYGTNGYFLKMENSGAMGTDSSGNSNTFTVNGTLTQNVDTPSNNYATFNPLVGYSNGNYVGTSRANTRAGINFGTTSTTLIPNKGKWFIEYHFQNASSNTDAGVGGWSINTSQVYGYGSAGFKGIVWKYAGNVYVDGTNNVVASDTYTNGDIISIAINYDDDLITFYKNGSTATNLINYSYSFSNYSDFSTGILDGASSSTYDENFDLNAGQNPTFGGRKTAGTYADANGHGLFSMAVPSGYYAINTKNIKEFG